MTGPIEPVVVVTDNPPVCKLCHERRFLTWNPKLGPPARLPRAAFYVLVAGTTGRFRHICRACQKQTGDEIMARFIAPEEA